MTNVAVLVTGGRYWSYGERIRRDLTSIYNDMLGPEGIMYLYEGGAPGADAAAGEWGRNMHHETRYLDRKVHWTCWPAEWVELGSEAGPKRNATLARWAAATPDCDAFICLAYPTNVSRGTHHMMKMAEQEAAKTKVAAKRADQRG